MAPLHLLSHSLSLLRALTLSVHSTRRLRISTAKTHAPVTQAKCVQRVYWKRAHGFEPWRVNCAPRTCPERHVVHGDDDDVITIIATGSGRRHVARAKTRRTLGGHIRRLQSPHCRCHAAPTTVPMPRATMHLAPGCTSTRATQGNTRRIPSLRRNRAIQPNPSAASERQQTSITLSTAGRLVQKNTFRFHPPPRTR